MLSGISSDAMDRGLLAIWRVLTISQTPPKALSEREKEHQRFYLLPGMGGRAVKRKQKWMLQWAVGIGLLVSAFLAVLLYLANHIWK